MKFLKETYKTADGAQKRCRFENGVAKSEYDRGYKAKHCYRYGIMQQGDGTYQVYRDTNSCDSSKS